MRDEVGVDRGLVAGDEPARGSSGPPLAAPTLPEEGPKPARITYLDFWRGTFALFMVSVHAINFWVRPSRLARFRWFVRFMDSVPAGFFILMGISFVVSRATAPPSRVRAAEKYAGKGIALLFMGFSLSLFNSAWLWPFSMTAFDIFHYLGFTYFAFSLIVLAAPRSRWASRWRASGYLLASVLSLVAYPLVRVLLWEVSLVDQNSLVEFLLRSVYYRGVFPVIPWWFYTFLGGFLGHVLLWARQGAPASHLSGKARVTKRELAFGGGLLVAGLLAGLAFRFIPWGFRPPWGPFVKFMGVTFEYLAFALAAALLTGGVLFFGWLALAAVGKPPTTRQTGLFSLYSKYSLAAFYVPWMIAAPVHVLWWRYSLGVPSVLAAAAALNGGFYLGLRAWDARSRATGGFDRLTRVLWRRPAATVAVAGIQFGLQAWAYYAYANCLSPWFFWAGAVVNFSFAAFFNARAGELAWRNGGEVARRGGERRRTEKK
ncbi:MAG: hypothetical protein Kow0069_13630 [Promethearchaeota archaeon]